MSHCACPELVLAQRFMGISPVLAASCDTASDVNTTESDNLDKVLTPADVPGAEIRSSLEAATCPGYLYSSKEQCVIRGWECAPLPPAAGRCARTLLHCKPVSPGA